VLILAGIVVVSSSALAATIPVNSTADEEKDDGFITLREALKIANGARAPWNSNDPNVDDEAGLISPSPYGANVEDRIRVDLAAGDRITLNDYLPPLNDSTDFIQADSLTIVDGSNLPKDAAEYAFHLAQNGHEIGGFTVTGFKGDAVRVTGSHNLIHGMIVKENGGDGILLVGASAVSNTIRNCVSEANAGVGIYVSGGAKRNLLKSCHINNNQASGLVVADSGTTSNTFVQCNVGVTEPPTRRPAGNGGYGIWLRGGASGNVFGDKSVLGAVSIVANNALGGVMIEGKGTDRNEFFSMYIGGASPEPPWQGNGSGHGIVIRDQAKNNSIGRAGTAFVIGGHEKNGILVTDPGTDGAALERIFIGHFDQRQGKKLTNKGHGIELANGVKNTRVGYDELLRQIEINHTGPGKHGLFINGNNPEVAVENVIVGNIYFGDDRLATTEAVFGGDAIHVSGNVASVRLGNPGHSNSINGATGYGVYLDGPNVRDIQINMGCIGQNVAFSDDPMPNEKGGICIRNGAHHITIGGESSAGACYISGNNGPGIYIDATDTENLPHDITIANNCVGLVPDLGQGPVMGNKGDGVFIQGPMRPTGSASGAPPVLANLKIGLKDKDAPNAIGGNLGNGIHLENVSGVQIVRNEIGTGDPASTPGGGNTQNGILVDGCSDIDIGSSLPKGAGNVISSNAKAGIRITNASNTLRIHQNRIGLTGPVGANDAADAAAGNTEAGILVEAPGPPKDKELLIGGRSEIAGNVPVAPVLFEGNIISGNAGPGILLKTASGSSEKIERVKIQGNLLGTNATGMGAVTAPGPGIRLQGSGVVGALIGDKTNGYRVNVISGNVNGIEIDGAADWRIWGNVVGLNRKRTAAVANTQNGVGLRNTTQGELGSGSDGKGANIISGNARAGVLILEGVHGNVTISKNLIGTDKDGLKAVGNQDGVVIRAGAAAAGARLTIGGSNASIAAQQSAELGAGNLISGNTRDGVRIGRLDGPAAGSSLAVDVFGNLIGADLTGLKALPNEGCGIRVRGAEVAEVKIGSDGGESSANLISGNKKDGVLLEEKAAKVKLYCNRIGCAADLERELPNEGNGVHILGGAKGNVVEKNIIYYNKQDGVRVSGAGTDRNRLTRNSIHRNEKQGIAVAEGANGGIKPPVLDHLYRQGRRTDRIRGAVAANGGAIETFTDPMATGNRPGFWGQGKRFEGNATPSSSGDFAVYLTGNPGIVTATVTDSQGNTSEFSPYAQARVIQTVSPSGADLKDEKPLLASHKKTVVRVYTHTGIGTSRVKVSGQLEVFGAPPECPTPPFHMMRPFGAYDGAGNGNDFLRAEGKDTLNFFIPLPPAGEHKVEVELFEYSADVLSGAADPIARGQIDLGTATFQDDLDRESLVLLPLRSEATSLGPVKEPDMTMALKGVWYFANLYPVDPVRFMGSLRMLPPRYVSMPRFDVGQSAVLTHLDNLHEKTRVKGIKPGHLVAYVNHEVGLDSQGATYGVAYPRLRIGSWVENTGLRTAVVVDKRVETDRFGQRVRHTGNYLCHEVGHMEPYFLGDTFPGGQSQDVNPRYTSGPRAGGNGNKIPENDFAYDCHGIGQFRQFDSRTQETRSTNIPGPASSVVSGESVLDFMGSQIGAWIDAPTNRALFSALGAAAAAAQSGAQKSVSQASVPARVAAGSIDTSDTVALLPVQRATVSDAVSSLSLPNAQYSVELQNRSGAVIDETDLEIAFEIEKLGRSADTEEDYGRYDPTGLVPFRAVLRETEPAHRVVFKKGETVLASIEQSPSTPTVSLLFPHGPGDLPPDELVLVAWTAFDADDLRAEGLSFDVLYTPDGGNTILPLATNLQSTTTFAVDAGQLPGGGPARFIVRASDGWNQSEAVSDPPFTVSDRTPTVRIAQPANADAFLTDSPVGLLGLAYDQEDGALTSGSLVWTIDGVTSPTFATGIGPTVLIPEGTHTLRLTATDSFGHSVFDEISVGGTATSATLQDIVDYFLERTDELLPGTDANRDGQVDVVDAIVEQLGQAPSSTPNGSSHLIAIGDASALQLNPVRVPVRLSGGTAAAGVNVRVAYDPAVLGWPGVEAGDLLTGGAHVVECHSPSSGRINVTAYGPSVPTAFSGASGAAFYLTFQVKGAVSLGTVTTIGLAQEIVGPPGVPASALCDAAGNALAHSFSEGRVTVQTPPTPTPTPLPTAVPTPTPPSPSEAARALIASFYNVILGRDSEPGAVDAWHHGYFDYAVSFNIDVRFIPREMARLFFLSEEYALRNRSNAEFIADCYLVFLQRNPSETELQNWLAGVWDRSQVMTVFSESEEFANRIQALFPGLAGNPPRDFVTAMYVGLLDRLVDRNGLEYASGLFDAAMAQGGLEAVRAQAKQMTREVIVSEEFLSKGPQTGDYVVRFYRAFLGRFPNDAEINYWTSELDAQRQTTDAVIGLFADSVEFAERLRVYFETP
jgi:hypothetical protein